MTTLMWAALVDAGPIRWDSPLTESAWARALAGTSAHEPGLVELRPHGTLDAGEWQSR